MVAVGSELSILGLRVWNSASVRSEVRHSAAAFSPFAAGAKGVVHFAASGVDRMLVVVCRSFCAWRQTSCLSAVKLTSHSSTPAPIAAAARFDSTVCSGNIKGAPRWPIENAVTLGVWSLQDISLSLSAPAGSWSIR